MSIEKAELTEQSVRADLDYQQIRLDSPCTPQDFSALRKHVSICEIFSLKGVRCNRARLVGSPRQRKFTLTNCC